ncbi:MAG: TonB-dependent receptor [Tannerella sp.]|jgi:TonB-linked SusC/RagA family outer membrane protein|nr:TonB-dependent receptor [Tannerella sp.]
MAKVVNYIRFTSSLLIFGVFFCFRVLAQPESSGLIIKGKVLDKKTEEVLPGASIFSTLQQVGNITNVDGEFDIQVKQLPVTLSVSYLGYMTEEITVGDASVSLTVFLSENTNQLNEVVVVGYGTQRRKELTGAIATVSKASLEYNTFNSVDLLLSGAVSGVNVTQSSGQPGAPARINIRGSNSVKASNNPLYVIDGFLFFGSDASSKAGMNAIENELNPLSILNTADIESVEILKDVSATAIYGSRGANGVILITTQKGKRDKGRVSYHYSTGWDIPSKKIDLLNASQWARIQKDFFFNKGRYTEEEIAALGDGYNWQNAVLQTGIRQTHNLSVSGGNEAYRYLLSGNYTDQTGIVIHSGFRRYIGRLNMESKLGDKLTFGLVATAGKSLQNSITTFEEVTWSSSPFGSGITNSLVYALFVPPVVPIYAENGDYNYHNPYEYGYLTLNGTTANPVADLRNSIAENSNTTLLGNFFARYEIADGLTARINAGIYSGQGTQNYFSPSRSALGLNVDGIGGIGKRQQEIRLAEYTLSYVRHLNDRNLVDVIAGYTSQHTHTGYLINMTTAFTDETHGIDYLALGAKPSHPVSFPSKEDLSSLLGRINYSLLGRYNVTVTFRGDKSSHFPQGHEWGYFPSAGFSWNISEEPFYQGVKKSRSSRLKFRVSGGSVGNQEIEAYQYAQTFTAGFYNGQGLLTQSNLGNAGLKWETTTQFNTGVDVGWLNDRITLTADLYLKKTYDLLMSLPVNPSLGVKEQLFNAGNTSNRGWEVALNFVPVDTKKVHWSLAFNMAKNKNRVDKIDSDRQKITLGNNGEEILKVGESLGSFYGLKFDGIVQKNEDTSTLPTTVHGAPRPGDAKFADLSGPDGIPDGRIDSNDLTVIGSIQPDYIFGLQSTLNWHPFDLFISLQGTQGNEVFNSLRRYLETPNDSYNGSAALLDSWTENNPSNTMATLSNYRYYSQLDSRYVEDASFLRLQNVTLGYELNILNCSGRLFVSAQNLCTFTKYKGYDPEISRGIDFGAYPSATSFSTGINIKF